MIVSRKPKTLLRLTEHQRVVSVRPCFRKIVARQPGVYRVFTWRFGTSFHGPLQAEAVRRRTMRGSTAARGANASVGSESRLQRWPAIWKPHICASPRRIFEKKCVSARSKFIHICNAVQMSFEVNEWKLEDLAVLDQVDTNSWKDIDFSYMYAWLFMVGNLCKQFTIVVPNPTSYRPCSWIWKSRSNFKEMILVFKLI